MNCVAFHFCEAIYDYCDLQGILPSAELWLVVFSIVEWAVIFPAFFHIDREGPRLVTASKERTCMDFVPSRGQRNHVSSCENTTMHCFNMFRHLIFGFHGFPFEEKLLRDTYQCTIDRLVLPEPLRLKTEAFQGIRGLLAVWAPGGFGQFFYLVV